jgi:hypothetical protein
MVSIEHDHDELQHVEDDASFKVIGSLRPAAIKRANPFYLLTRGFKWEIELKMKAIDPF